VEAGLALAQRGPCAFGDDPGDYRIEAAELREPFLQCLVRVQNAYRCLAAYIRQMRRVSPCHQPFSISRQAQSGAYSSVKPAPNVDRLTRATSPSWSNCSTNMGIVSPQSFNTASSMGRLTLNVLLSVAQFEREVIGERVRDKIAASNFDPRHHLRVARLDFRVSRCL
jgi:hypothetical protein